MKYADITPGLYWVRPERKSDRERGNMVYKIDPGAAAGTRFRTFKHKSGWDISPNTAKLHIRAYKMNVDAQTQDPWATCIPVRNILEPFTFPAVTRAAK